VHVKSLPAHALRSLMFRSFPLTIHHVGYGPDPRQPRQLWADCLATNELAAMRVELPAAFEQKDDRPFRPHVTLARIRGNGRAIARKHPIDRSLSLTQLIVSIQLFQSPSPGNEDIGCRRDSH